MHQKTKIARYASENGLSGDYLTCKYLTPVCPTSMNLICQIHKNNIHEILPHKTKAHTVVGQCICDAVQAHSCTDTSTGESLLSCKQLT